MNNLKQEIKKLKKLKLECRSGSKERIELYRKIKELKLQLTKEKESNKEKEKVIIEILKLIPQYIKDINVDYNKHSMVDLQKHLNKLRRV
ncbi:MAG TPA: hypothetical protein VGB37_09315 [Candidatus Lokiarchaeia archaeon]